MAEKIAKPFLKWTGVNTQFSSEMENVLHVYLSDSPAIHAVSFKYPLAVTHVSLVPSQAELFSKF